MLVLNSLTPRAPGHIRSHQSTRRLQDHHESLHLTTTADLHREKRWEKNGNRRQEEQTREQAAAEPRSGGRKPARQGAATGLRPPGQLLAHSSSAISWEREEGL